jgi:biopolymer transport protein ExbD
MAMSVGRARTGAIAEINVTPMADVMIVLLIIFMVMTPIINAPRVLLPEATNAAERRGQRIEIVVGASGNISVGQDTFGSVEGLGDFLAVKAAGADPPTVLVQADRGVRYADVARVLAACRRAKVQEVALAARTKVDR